MGDATERDATTWDRDAWLTTRHATSLIGRQSERPSSMTPPSSGIVAGYENVRGINGGTPSVQDANNCEDGACTRTQHHGLTRLGRVPCLLEPAPPTLNLGGDGSALDRREHERERATRRFGA